MRRIYLLTIILCSLGGQLFAGRMDSNTHDLVINKLESALPVLKGQKSEIEVLVRLADLYADRARLKSIEENEKNCVGCLKIQNDRERAIQFYMTAIEKSRSEQDARWIIQVSHLYNLNGEARKAKNILQSIIREHKKFNPNAVGEAYALLGELLYREGDFKNAEKNFNLALKYKISNPDHVHYRLAWCAFNQGELTTAKKSLKKLLSKSQFSDESLRKDYVRDYVTFTARGNITNAAIDEIRHLSAEGQFASNIFYLGQECDRLGNKSGSIVVWGVYAKLPKENSDEYMEMMIRKAQALLDQNQIKQSIVHYTQFFEEFSKGQCEVKEHCAELQSRSRAYVVNWIKKNKANPNRDLLTALQVYTKNNNSDLEMINWAGHIARHLEIRKEAVELYQAAANVGKSNINKRNFDILNEEQTVKIYNGALLAQIEIAEEMHDIAIRRRAYNFYLALEPSGENALQVQYQLAYLSYEEKKYEQAGLDFTNIALKLSNDKKAEKDLKIKAADLALESFDKINAYDLLIEKSNLLAKSVPSREMAYLGVNRKATVNKSVQLAASKNNTQIEKSILLLESAPLAGATEQEKLQIYKNLLTLSAKTLDLNRVESAAQNILKIKSANQNDLVAAKEKLLWVYESRFEFVSAIHLVKKSPELYKNKEEQQLKIAVLTELADLPSEAEYKKYLRLTSNKQKANIVRAKLVRESQNPWQMLASQKTELIRQPELYSVVLFEAYAKSPNKLKYQSHLQNLSPNKRKNLKAIETLFKLEDMRLMSQQTAKQKLNGAAPSKLRNSLDQRLSSFKNLNKQLKTAQKQGDVLGQLAMMSVLAQENSRLANEISNLPIPRSLIKKQREEYQKALITQASPFVNKSKEFEAGLKDLWSNLDFVDQISKQLEKQTPSENIIFSAQLNLLAKSLDADRSAKITTALLNKQNEISTKEVAEARAGLKKDPFNSDKILKLRKLEYRRGSSTMVAYLDARLTQVQKGRL